MYLRKMSRIKTILIALAFCILPAFGSNVEVEIIDGVNNQALKNKIENNAAKFLDEINEAFSQNRALNLNGIMTETGQASVEMLWENVHFHTEDSYIGESLIGSKDGYQIRNISLEILPQDSGAESEYKEAVLKFDFDGSISDVYFSIENNTYKQIMETGVELDDLERRMQILDYVERFRTSYNTKDLAFLNQVFSDDALIITGKVITPKKNYDGVGFSLPQVKYTKQGKKEYLSNLAQVFKRNRYINVTFDDVQIRRHGRKKDIYGVRVVQHYSSSTYSDEGYVFMVWDFTNPDSPEIHVRTWQPMFLDKKKTQRLPESDIFDLDAIDGI